MLLATDYPFLDIFWTMLVFFAWVIWFWLLIAVFSDLFRRHDISGWTKALWMIFVIVVPYLGVFIYLITQSSGMDERRQKQAEAAQAQVADYVRSVSAQSDPAEQIAKAKQLLDSGTISQSEYEALKQKALA